MRRRSSRLRSSPFRTRCSSAARVSWVMISTPWSSFSGGRGEPLPQAFRLLRHRAAFELGEQRLFSQLCQEQVDVEHRTRALLARSALALGVVGVTRALELARRALERV